MSLRRTLRRTLLAMSLSPMLACSPGSAGTPSPHPTTAPAPLVAPRPPALAAAQPADVQALGKADDAFAAELWKALAANADDNLVISPASLQLALGMTWGGARGETAAAIAHALHIDLPADRAHAAFGELVSAWNTKQDGFTMAVANRLFGAKGKTFVQAFLDLTRDRYAAELERLDFGDPGAAVARINKWVAERTADRIPQLLDPSAVDSSTAMVLVNALYLKGKWKNQFDPKLTANAPFHAPGGDVSAPLMRRHDKMRVGSTDDATIVELPFASGSTVMRLVLPKSDLASLEHGLSPAVMAAWGAALQEKDVVLRVPRLTLKGPTIRMSGALAALGMGVAFGDGADFHGIADDESMKIDEVYQQTFVQLDETGAEAAAATAVAMKTFTAEIPNLEVTFDRPFLFELRDTATGQLLFLGRVTNPT